MPETIRLAPGCLRMLKCIWQLSNANHLERIFGAALRIMEATLPLLEYMLSRAALTYITKT